MTVLITLTTAGSDSGPFDLYSNSTGSWVKFEDNVPKSTLLAGYNSTLVPNGTTIVRVQSDGVCVNYIDIVLVLLTTTTTSTSSTSTSTTTSTTTVAPTISLGSATCRSGNCNDNASCGVHLPVNVYNAPVGYYVDMRVEATAGGSITYSQSEGYAVYTESSALSTLEVRFDLYNTFGGTLLATTGTQYLAHKSFWSMLNPCT